MENVNINLGGFIGLAIGVVIMVLRFNAVYEPGTESIPPHVISSSAVIFLFCIFGGNSAWQAAFSK